MSFSFLILILCVFFPTIYIAFLLWLIKGWYIPSFPSRRRPLPQGVKVSVVVAFRNEAENLPALLTSFQAQSYPKDLVEYILVNDHSEDEGLKVLESFQAALPLMVLQQEEGLQGKKAAISKAISQATGDLIITTDADCTAGPEWISAVVEHYRFNDCRMILGGVKYDQGASVLEKLQQIEFQTLIGTGACMAGLGLPSMGNGANLAYERSVFTDLGGYKGTPDTASGDDLFLMYRLHQKQPGSIQYLHASTAYVSTKASPDFAAFMQQRKRWAGKWSYYSLPWAKSLPIFLFFYYLLQLFVWGAALVTLYWPVLLLSFLTKAVADRLWLEPITREAGVRVPVGLWILLSLLYPFYAVFFGIFSKIGRYRWKGREWTS